MTPEKIKLKNYEFTDYKFKSLASRRVRKRMRRSFKRIKYVKSYDLGDEDMNVAENIQQLKK
jgi:hypothetical protein